MCGVWGEGVGEGAPTRPHVAFRDRLSIVSFGLESREPGIDAYPILIEVRLSAGYSSMIGASTWKFAGDHDRFVTFFRAARFPALLCDLPSIGDNSCVGQRVRLLRSLAPAYAREQLRNTV